MWRLCVDWFTVVRMGIVLCIFVTCVYRHCNNVGCERWFIHLILTLLYDLRTTSVFVLKSVSNCVLSEFWPHFLFSAQEEREADVRSEQLALDRPANDNYAQWEQDMERRKARPDTFTKGMRSVWWIVCMLWQCWTLMECGLYSWMITYNLESWRVVYSKVCLA